MSVFTAGVAPLDGYWKREEARTKAQTGPDTSDEAHALTAMPRVDRVRMAFEEIPLNPSELRSLSALLDAPGSTAQQFSATCGWMPSGWRTQMLLLCQRRRRFLWPEGMAADMTNGLIITALSVYDSDTLTFRPRPELTTILQDAVKAG